MDSINDNNKNNMDLESGNAHATAPLNPEADDKVLEDIPEWTKKEILVAALAAGSVIISIISIVLVSNPIADATGFFLLLIAPYSALQEQKITDCKAMLETNMAMERELENMRIENERLVSETTRLEGSVSHLHEMQVTLSEIRQMESASLDVLEELLQESKSILDSMETSHQNTVIDNIFDIAIASDKDEDFILSDQEITTLITRIEGINGVKINDELCRKMIVDKGRSLDSLMMLVKDIIDDDPNTAPSDEPIFTFVEGR